MSLTPARCLILACGNTLRGDDGVGPWLAEWAENRFRAKACVRVLSRQQWTPELAEEIAHAGSVLFIDCSVDSAPGSVSLISVQPAIGDQGLATHHLSAAELLALGRELYNSLPSNALLLTIGAGSTKLGESFSEAVTAALPHACHLVEEAVSKQLGNTCAARGV
jgi:hydrogenase maturation protease